LSFLLGCLVAAEKTPAIGRKIKGWNAPPQRMTRYIVAMDTAMEVSRTATGRSICFLVKILSKRNDMSSEKGDWNGHDGMKAAENDPTRRTVSPITSIVATE
jgi:hypothetical protein